MICREMLFWTAQADPFELLGQVLSLKSGPEMNTFPVLLEF